MHRVVTISVLSRYSVCIGVQSQIPEYTTAHEVGHALDYFGFTPGRYESVYGHELMPVLDACRASLAYRDIEALRAKLSIVDSDPNRERNRQIKLSRVNYLLKQDEVWGRAYAQWVATSSQDEQLLQEVNALRQDPAFSDLCIQWYASDFIRIGREIDLLFKRKGWLS